ncbi:MAG: hypothetical protein COA84_14215 [Robiginitomaculum sp.]|nr:MAG: hypothetical protein COA84_14215 [Robiginitomaculum sp.]
MNKATIREYRIWKAMKSRCYSPSNAESSYQKNGITVCDRWVNNFENFISDMGLAPSDKHSIDRVDNLGDYEPSNCKWSTATEQTRNRGSFNIIFKHDGKSMTLKEWSTVLNIKYITLHQRIFRSGMTFDEAIKKKTKALITVDGKSMILNDWAKIIGVNQSSICKAVTRTGITKEQYILKKLKDIKQ